ncbi:MAG: hypothetical protein PHE67_03720 [Campylobacterales bacterium]|nr:hypothetical protein [Campylobacterales bacterium]
MKLFKMILVALFFMTSSLIANDVHSNNIDKKTEIVVVGKNASNFDAKSLDEAERFVIKKTESGFSHPEVEFVYHMMHAIALITGALVLFFWIKVFGRFENRWL